MLARFALCFLLGTAFASAWAQPDPAAKKAELRELRDRIDALRKDLAKSEANRSEAADSLREAEKAISDSNRQLRELAQARAELRRELGALEAQADRLEGQIGTQQRQIGALLYRQHLQGRNIDDDALKLLLAGENPNQVARDYHYLKLLSHAKTEVVEDLRDALAQKQKLADAVRDKTDKLAANEKQQQAERQTLLAQQKQRQTVLAGIADKVKKQRRQIATLKQNEQRLSKLIDGLIRLVAKARRPAAKPAT
ncbi:MAG TPA: peptidase M23, partial [Rhodocyclaceae bacterium]|nr:peptidase M23 [Rhodocyclaceae bacterium]